MVTVPPRKKHSNDNTKDVKYVRNLIIIAESVNDVGMAMFPVRRSLKKSPKIKWQITQERAAHHAAKGQETAIITSESRRFKSRLI